MASIIRHLAGEPQPTVEPLNGGVTALTLPDDIQITPDPACCQDGRLPHTVAHSESQKRHTQRFQPSTLGRRLVVGDVVAVSFAWLFQAATNNPGHFGENIALGVVATLVTVLVMHHSGLYRSRVCATRSLETARIVVASAAGTIAFISCVALAGRTSHTAPLEAGAVAVVCIVLLRWRFNRWLVARRSASEFLRTVIMVGGDEDGKGLWTLLSEEPELGYRIAGVAGEAAKGVPWEGLPRCTLLESLDELARQVGADGVIIVASALASDERKRAVELALGAGLHVQVWPGLNGLSSRRVRIAPVSGVPLLYLEPREIAKWQPVVKRLMDLVLATLLLVITAPLIAVAALAIKLTDRGPVIYRSQRVGRYGKTIDVLKIRTMVPDASQLMTDVSDLNERTGGPLFKASHDPRVTRVGHLLRATSVDELPQLWNVLNGTMSMVGPRPALLHEVEQFDSELRRRHEMRPGITGLWQVEARDNPSFSAYRRLDLAYIDDWTLGLDIAIVAGTAYQLIARTTKTLAQLRPTARHRY